ncbi:MAG: Crp/Fnr family transcriptional regulator [Firmicutes bacterium]|nr:Crp/Fnr family transcriptional regulator [Bacillota bacterium]
MVNSVFLRKVYLFNELGEKELSKIQTISAEKRFPRHHVVFMENDVADGLYIVKAGSVKVFRSTEEGKEKILAIFSEGEVFGEMSLLDGGVRSATVQTLEETHLIQIKRNDFINLITQNPEVSARIITTLSHRLRKSNEQIEMMAFWDVRSRIIKVLYDLAQEHGVVTENGIKIRLRLTHQDLANMAATSRETVTRVLQELHDMGVFNMFDKYIMLSDIKQKTMGRMRESI